MLAADDAGGLDLGISETDAPVNHAADHHLCAVLDDQVAADYALHFQGRSGAQTRIARDDTLEDAASGQGLGIGGDGRSVAAVVMVSVPVAC